MRFSAGLLAACCVFFAPVVVAQDGAYDPAARPEAQGSLRDPEFGVRTSHLGLERQVEMFQWRQDGGGYAREWSDAWLDSTAFLPGHENPAFPIQSRRWPASAVTVDGVPLDPRVLEQLGEWREFRPSFSALPGNLSATFQPQGDGLGSALNPLAPEVGDLRIHWRELVLPPLGERVELRDGRWQLRADAATGAVQGNAVQAGDQNRGGGNWWIFIAGLAVVALAVVAIGRRRRR